LLDLVEAETFIDFAAGGGVTEPCMLLCRDSGGTVVRVFAKAAWSGCPVSNLAREVICNLLARDLGLSVPKAVLVNYDDAFVDSLDLAGPDARRMAARFRQAPSPAFGSVDLGPGFQECSASVDCPIHLLAEAWAFDRLILNADRRIVKPNSLSDGTKIFLIDHEKALNCDFLGTMLLPLPWQSGVMVDTETRAPHLFAGRFSKADLDLARLQAAWSKLTTNHFVRYRAAIPCAWNVAEQMLRETSDYLSALRDNLDEAFVKLSEALP
jgi:hypothetical protein